MFTVRYTASAFGCSVELKWSKPRIDQLRCRKFTCHSSLRACFNEHREMARSVGESASSVLERIFNSSDSEEVYSPSAEDDEESEGAEGSESLGTSVQLEGRGAVISDDENTTWSPRRRQKAN